MARVSTFSVSFFFFSFSFLITALAKQDGDEIGVYELKKGNMSMKVTNWGATIMSVVLPDKNGQCQ